MAEFAALPLFTDSLIADTIHLSNAEFGLYIRLLVLCWRMPNCKMPRDESWHMRRHSINYQQFSDLYKPLLNEFFKCDGNFYYQKRLLKEFEYLRKKHQKQSVAAKSRWNKEKDIYSGNAPHPTPPNPTLSNNIKKNNIITYTSEFIEFYELYPKHEGKNSALKAYNKAIKEGTKHENIIRGVKSYAEQLNRNSTERRYIAAPASWLNGKRWEDEYTITAQIRSSTGKPTFTSEGERIAREFMQATQP